MSRGLHAGAYPAMTFLMSDPFFFGYGSLVNRNTHSYPRAARATVKGWAREWKKSRLRKVVFLTAVEAPGVEIDGLIAAVPGADWAALDERERAYERLPVSEITHEHSERPPVEIYRARADHIEEVNEGHVMLLSYLDVVIQGYLREFGETGVAHFMETTRGWDVPVCDDRSQPIYPRGQRLSQRETGLVDEVLRDLQSEIIPVGNTDWAQP